MSRNTLTAALVALGLALMAGPGWARVGVEIWTDRGQDAVYKPGDLMQVKVRPSADAYLLVYEIDTEGYVRVLYPYRGQSGFVEGRRTLRVPDEDASVELVVERSTGEAYLVALASEDPFEEMPWYLRPYDARTEGVDYEGAPDLEEQGVTSEGRIVGDPFVAMERIRRRVLRSPDEPSSFGTSYTSYYVHERVRYPRYLCYDCHRPNRWAWWDGFDPYYSTCSVVDFRINWSWSWGPRYWFGYTPYWCYVIRPDCPPHWRHGWSDPWYSSWDGYQRWNAMWGGPLVRYKSPPPPGYTPPSKYDDPNRWRGGARPLPPGYLAGDADRGRYRPAVPIGRNREARESEGNVPGVGRTPRPNAERMPAREVRGDDDRGSSGGAYERPRREARPQPAGPSRGDYTPSRESRGGDRPPATTREDRRQQPAPAPASPPREDRPSQSSPPPAPREERAERSSPPPPPPPAPAPRHDSGGGGGGRERRR